MNKPSSWWATTALSTCLALAGTVALAPAAKAAEVSSPASQAAASSVSEIVVTAQKREEALSKVPVAVTAFTGTQLMDRGYTSILDFTGAVADLSISVNSSMERVSERGVYQAQDLPAAIPSVAFHVNGVFISSFVPITSSFYDVSRIEVLKGPQGTLYGQDAVGGTINLITNRPTDRFEASAQVSYGNYQAISSRAMISGPITDKLFVRLAIATDNHDGYSLNIFNGHYEDGQNSRSGRLTIVYEPTSNLTFTTFADFHRENDSNYATHFGGVVPAGSVLQGVQLGGTALPVGPDGLTLNPRLIDDFYDTLNKRQSYGLAEEIVWRINDNFTLKSITSFEQSKLFYGSDIEATTFQFPTMDPFNGGVLQPAFNYDNFGKYHEFSQEFNLIGNIGRLNFVTGLYYLKDVTTGGFTLGEGPVDSPFPFLGGGREVKPEYAAFGQATYNVTDKLAVTAGLRFTSQSVSVDLVRETTDFMLLGGVANPDRHCLTLPNEICELVAKKSFTSWTPRFEAHYQWTPGLMTYASVSEGYEAGGFAISSLQPAFLPATVWSEEVGAKWRSGDGRWSIDTAAFHYTYTNMQVSEAIHNITTIVNAARAQAYGFELESTLRPIEHLTITDAFAFLDAHYTDFMEENPNEPFQGPNGIINNAGHQLPFMSKYTNNVRASYDIPIGPNKVTLSGEWNWRTKQYYSEIDDSLEEQPAYSTFNASIRFTNEPHKWYIELYGRNLSNALITTLTNIGGCGCLNSQYAPPRTYGVTFNFEY